MITESYDKHRRERHSQPHMMIDYRLAAASNTDSSSASGRSIRWSPWSRGMLSGCTEGPVCMSWSCITGAITSPPATIMFIGRQRENGARVCTMLFASVAVCCTERQRHPQHVCSNREGTMFLALLRRTSLWHYWEGSCRERRKDTF